MSTETNRESSIRRKLAANGFRLSKRDGGYMIVEGDINAAVSGSYPLPYSDTLADVEAFAAQYA